MGSAISHLIQVFVVLRVLELQVRLLDEDRDFLELVICIIALVHEHAVKHLSQVRIEVLRHRRANVPRLSQLTPDPLQGLLGVVAHLISLLFKLLNY